MVGLTSGKRRHISDFDSGVNAFNKVCSIRTFFGIRLMLPEANRRSKSGNAGEMLGTGPIEVWVLLKNGLLFAVILSFCFLSRGDRPFRQGGCKS